MNETTLPPSPNWYLSTIFTCAKDGTVAWGARNTIVIAKPKENSRTLKYSIITNAHRDRVVSLAFSHECEQLNKNLLISGGDDHIVKIWNLDDLTVALTYSYPDPKQTVIAVDWSVKDPNLACSITTEGSLALWNVVFDTCRLISLGKLTATCLSCCPHDSNIVAVGSKSGLIYIVDIRGKGLVNYKLRGHDVEITSLSWCPTDINVLTEGNKRDLLLASGGKDRSIYIWKAGGDGRYQTEIAIPNTPLDSQQHRSKLSATTGNWTVVRWIEPKLLLSSSSWGELVSWDLSMTNKKPVCKVLHAYHPRGLFCIVNVPNNQETNENWRVKNSITIWTLAQDRQIICCTLAENNVEIQYNIPTQGGYVYCIAACPLDTSRIAFGAGDMMIRLWNLSEPHETSFDITMLWQKIKAKVRAISWHPEKENILAYGTGEGRIGVLDANSNKLPVLYRQYHRSTIYTLGWGPDCNGKHVLYSCGEGELVSYSPEKPNDDPRIILKKECTDFSWKPDFSCLAVGFENGSVVFYDRNLMERGRSTYPLKKTVQCLAWHPESTATDLQISPMRNYLAVACDAPTITIFDLSDLISYMDDTKSQNIEVIEDKENSMSDPIIVQKIAMTLSGHTDKVVSLAWSPHFSGQLISASYDNTVQVWKVETQELIGTFTSHCAPVLCCMWSPLDPDFIISGSADFTIRIWKLSEHPPVMPTGNAFSKKSKSKKNKHKANRNEKSKTNHFVQNGLTETIEATSETPASEALADESKTKVIPVKEMQTKRTQKISSYFSKNGKMMYEKSFILNSIKTLLKNRENNQTDSQNSEVDDEILSPFFLNQENFLSFLATEKSAHIEQDRYNMATEMDIWCNNLKENLEEAAKEKRLNDFLVSLAPSLSMKMWKDMCEAYANQLILECNLRKAVSYLLCIHKVYEAIDVFLNANLYKEAYALARCKLDCNDPLLTSILQRWANYEVEVAQFEQAALCYVKLGEFSKAAKYLARRKDTDSLEIAAELASLSNDNILYVSLLEQTIIESLKTFDYIKAQSVIIKHPCIKYREVHLNTFEEVLKVVKSDLNVQEWIEGKSDYGILQSFENSVNNEYYLDLCKTDLNVTAEDEVTLWLNVSHQIAMAVTCDNNEKRLNHIVAALGSIYQYETLGKKNTDKQEHFLIQILSNLDARSPINENSIYARNDHSVSKSLRAYLCLGLLRWIVDNMDSLTEESVQSFIAIIEEMLEDVLDRQTVRYWSITNEINKLETQLTAALGKSQTADEDENISKTTELVEKLDGYRNEKKQFIQERVCAPSPIVAYCKAMELIDMLPDSEFKEKFTKLLSEIWMKAIS